MFVVHLKRTTADQVIASWDSLVFSKVMLHGQQDIRPERGVEESFLFLSPPSRVAEVFQLFAPAHVPPHV